MERYYQPEIECASREQILAWQNERLVKQVQNVWDNVPYYRKKMEEKGFVRLNYGLLKIVILFFFDSFSNCNLKDGSLGWNYLFGK